jgi:hypothetical protein
MTKEAASILSYVFMAATIVIVAYGLAITTDRLDKVAAELSAVKGEVEAVSNTLNAIIGDVP